MSRTPYKFKTCKCIFRQEHIVNLSVLRKISMCMALVGKSMNGLEIWAVVGGWICVLCVTQTMQSSYMNHTIYTSWICVCVSDGSDKADGKHACRITCWKTGLKKRRQHRFIILKADLIPQCPWHGLWIVCVFMDLAGGCLSIVVPLIFVLTQWDLTEKSNGHRTIKHLKFCLQKACINHTRLHCVFPHMWFLSH